MKRERIFLKVVVAMFATVFAAGFALLVACDNAEFTGNRVANPDSYTLEIEQMNGIDRHTMSLSAGDVLEVRFVAEKGSLTLEIEAEDGTKLYSGNGTELSDFTLDVDKVGDYTITVKAKNAKGEISVRLAKPQLFSAAPRRKNTLGGRLGYIRTGSESFNPKFVIE